MLYGVVSPPFLWFLYLFGFSWLLPKCVVNSRRKTHRVFLHHTVKIRPCFWAARTVVPVVIQCASGSLIILRGSFLVLTFFISLGVGVPNVSCWCRLCFSSRIRGIVCAVCNQFDIMWWLLWAPFSLSCLHFYFFTFYFGSGCAKCVMLTSDFAFRHEFVV